MDRIENAQMNSQGTRKLYYENVHQTDFTAVVMECVPDKEEGYYRIVLDASAFFPEEGGQSADKHHDQGENLVRRLGGPRVSEEVAHIGAGIEEDADEGREAEQPQDHGNENDA